MQPLPNHLHEQPKKGGILTMRTFPKNQILSLGLFQPSFDANFGWMSDAVNNRFFRSTRFSLFLFSFSRRLLTFPSFFAGHLPILDFCFFTAKLLS